MLEGLLIGVAGVVVLLLAVAATRPSGYHVERRLEVAAPVELVFGVLNDLRQFAQVLVLFGSPLEEGDPTLQRTLAGPAAGVGQSYGWSGGKAGQGTMTIEESVPGQRVGIRLVFVKPMASTSTCTFTLASTPTGSSVVWSMDGNHNFLGKVLGLVMNMDRMLGADLESGLAQLKRVAEGGRR